METLSFPSAEARRFLTVALYLSVVILLCLAWLSVALIGALSSDALLAAARLGAWPADCNQLQAALAGDLWQQRVAFWTILAVGPAATLLLMAATLRKRHWLNVAVLVGLLLWLLVVQMDLQGFWIFCD